MREAKIYYVSNKTNVFAVAMNGQPIKQKRQSAGIAGSLLCSRANLNRGRLSHIERGYVTPSRAELIKIDVALNELIKELMSDTSLQRYHF